ncbi:MAG: hypothetical protein AAFY11_00380 [Cyanobacteria bacterium J06641_5]
MSNRVTKSTTHARNFFPLAGVRQFLQQQISLELQGLWSLVPISPPKTIFLLRQHLGYSSPFACQVVRSTKMVPAELAARVAAHLISKRRVRAKLNGWLEFDLLPSEFENWLARSQTAARSPLARAGVEVLPTGASVGLHQYAHARCCNWLLLGRETGLLATEAIAWERLLTDASTSQVELLGVLLDLGDRATEVAVDREVAVDGNDARAADETDVRWALEPSTFGEAEALRLAAAILAFQQDYPLWGEHCRLDRSLAQAQLGLIEIARSVLAWLLEVSLELPAPQNL